MPETMHLPFIKSEDYDAFLVLLKADLPASYGEWLVWHTNKIDNYSTQFRVLDIEVKPDDYIAFCAAERRTYNTRVAVGLRRFCREQKIGFPPPIAGKHPRRLFAGRRRRRS